MKEINKLTQVQMKLFICTALDTQGKRIPHTVIVKTTGLGYVEAMLEQELLNLDNYKIEEMQDERGIMILLYESEPFVELIS